MLESGDVNELDSLGGWDDLPDNSSLTWRQVADEKNEDTTDSYRRPFLVYFRSTTAGMQQHDYDSPSFFNISEIGIVVNLCLSLTQSANVDVSPQDIGVIGAFRAQVFKQ